ncbi:Aldehyde/histidinol dehydrogenase [Protomyces lactucae-debilis]|uniref:glutamate-5-semialdehyde dehydrogenase n=1 Tax=Protomyces lactucae-debilis TaxID=2754530 RepID=A0A1Y2EXH1_PROLT|nr:Aldehyde/histidinol dehydrogenase [Protomyces lactucae-debilis]ORY76312.1 Aldehyde/histidinol dehydrogenase [Protomyces lactucae-debilis]
MEDSVSYRIAKGAREASHILATLPASTRSDTLQTLYTLLGQEQALILQENARDVDAARKAGLAGSLISRLDLNKPGKFEAMRQGVLDVAALSDLVGTCTQKRQLDSDGLVLRRVLCPIGVLLVIFEARPEVVVNITALALKSGNAAILKGGKESLHSFKCLASIVERALQQHQIPQAAISLVESRNDVADLLNHDTFIDLVIPRGSNALVKQVQNTTKIAVMGHADGVCHAFVDADADPATVARLLIDAKTDYPAACNALETIILHKDWAAAHLDSLLQALQEAQVTIKMTKDLFSYTTNPDTVQEASDADFGVEWLDLTVSVRSADSVTEAIAFINAHSSHHTDTILTNTPIHAQTFQRGVDSACVFVNCSTRFADGMRFGLGTEVGIATGKIHARGPVGLEGLMTYKWLLDGQGHDVARYGAGGSATFKHKDLQVDAKDAN